MNHSYVCLCAVQRWTSGLLSQMVTGGGNVSLLIAEQEPDVIHHILRDFMEQCNIAHHAHFILVIIILDIYILTFISGRRCWTSMVFDSEVFQIHTSFYLWWTLTEYIYE